MVKVFISYSHPDWTHIEDFRRFIQPLCDNGKVDLWYDRNILGGDDFWSRIDEHLAERDIVCLFISSHYLASGACKEEMKRAFSMKQHHNIAVVPIILSPCLWLDNEYLKKSLALPTDGKPVSSFDDKDSAWMNVCEGLKPVIEKMEQLKNLKLSESHIKFLNDASLFTKAHENKEVLTMEDIFVSPDLGWYNEEKNKQERTTFDEMCDKIVIGNKVVIAGEDQSGKTTLAKVLIQRLKERNFIPIYIKDEQEMLQGNLEYRVSQLFKSQYENGSELSDYEKELVVPIVDDFHKAHKKELAIERLGSFKQLILIVDTIFDLEMYKKDLVSGFDRYRIKPLKPSLRNALIRKWLSISDRVDTDPDFINNDLAQIDARTDMINQTLGKTIGSGLMPAYPFFLLTLLSNYETLNNRINDEIASQGYYYQALIILFLAKEKVTNDKIDTYLNFLTELSYAIFHNKAALSQATFDEFFARYEEQFNLPEPRTILLDKLKRSGILKVTSLGNYDFDYPYLYYFFVGKYFSEHFDGRYDENNQAISEVHNILDNLHKNENAYITIFLVHHSKDQNLISEIEKRADAMFNEFAPATLNREELAFFKPNIVERQNLTDGKQNVAEERKKNLARQDAVEEAEQNREEDLDDEDDNGLSAQLRRSIKTVEVMGCILRNRAGWNRKKLEQLFEKGTNVHLRIVSSFFDLVQNMIKKENYDDFIQKRVAAKNPKMSESQVKVVSQNIFWNLNFGFILGMIDRITMALGAKTLISISDSVCDKIDSPASFIIKENIAMRYQHNIRIDEIKAYDTKRLAPLSKNALLFFVNQFCKYNRIEESDRQRLKNLGLSVNKQPLLMESNQERS